MKNISRLLMASLIGSVLFPPALLRASPRQLSLAEALNLGERASPDLKAGAAGEAQAQASLSIARSALYPTLDLSAVDSVGFPGSTSPVPPELAGIMTSPYRVGAAAGVLTRVTLFDLSNWYGIDAAQGLVSAAAERSKVVRLRVDQQVLESYIEASRVRGDLAVWVGIAGKVTTLEKSVQGFVKNGQASEVAGLLISDQADESRMNQLTYEMRYEQALTRLALLTGTRPQDIDCPEAALLRPDDLHFIKAENQSPLLSQSGAELSAAQAFASESSARNLLKLYAAASAGFLSDSRLVEKQNYAAWLGVTIPLFEGFRISSETQRARSAVDEKGDLLSATQLKLDTDNARLDEIIRVSRLELKLLAKQHDAATRAFALAKRRYLSFLEPVINLREAIRNLARIEIQTNEANADLILASASRSLLNGEVLSP